MLLHSIIAILLLSTLTLSAFAEHASSFSVGHHKMENHLVMSKIHKRISRRDTNYPNSFTDDEVGWANINELVDICLEKVWKLMVDKGYTSLALPNITETIAVKLVLFTTNPDIQLSNGRVFNLRGLERVGDSFMTYRDHSFRFTLNLGIRSGEIVYDFILKIIGITGGGTIEGNTEDILVSGDFSITARNTIISLDELRITSIGNLKTRLQAQAIISQLSSSIVTPITRFVEDILVDSISKELLVQLRSLIAEVNEQDYFELKTLIDKILGKLIKQT